MPKKYELVIYAITENGNGKVVEHLRTPLFDTGTIEIPIRLFREDVVLTMEIQEEHEE